MSPFSKYKFLAVILAIVAVNCLTLNLYSTVWMDEAAYTDPAANHALGHGFISTAWFETSHETWSGNVPLHAGLLSGWFQLFGFGMVQTRLFNLLIWALAVAVVCAAVRRFRFVRTDAGLCVLAAILMMGDSVTFNYRSGRYDPLMFLLAATALLAFSIQDKRWRCGLLLMVSSLFLPAAPALGPFSVMIGLWLLGFTGLRYFRELVTVGCGLLLGFAALFGFYHFHGTWQSFLQVTAIAKSLNFDPAVCNVFRAKTAALPSLYIQDKSLVIAFLFLIPACCLNWKRWSGGERRIVRFCVSLYCVLPTAFLYLYAFPFYYCWMVYVPVCICTVTSLEATARALAGWRRTALWLCPAVMISAVGLPMRTGLALFDLQERDYGRVKSFVSSVTHPDDVVYADYQVFYAVHELNIRTYYSWYLRVMTDEERKSIDCLVINPNAAEVVKRVLGGNWRPTGETYLNEGKFGVRLLDRVLPHYFHQQTTLKYNLAVYRRVN